MVAGRMTWIPPRNSGKVWHFGMYTVFGSDEGVVTICKSAAEESTDVMYF